MVLLLPLLLPRVLLEVEERIPLEDMLMGMEELEERDEVLAPVGSPTEELEDRLELAVPTDSELELTLELEREVEP